MKRRIRRRKRDTEVAVAVAKEIKKKLNKGMEMQKWTKRKAMMKMEKRKTC